MPKGVANKRYTPEFKKKVVETMMEEKLSFNFCTGCVEVEFASRQKARH